jgi:NADH:ubiquinone oxidoreductase subunit F (NADH-binding)
MANQQRSGLLELLHNAVSQRGYLTEEAIDELSYQLNLSPSKIFGQASQFRELPTERIDLHVKVCAGPCCALEGSLDLSENLAEGLTGFKGRVKVEKVYGLPYWHLPIAIEVSGRARKTKIFHDFDAEKITIFKKLLMGEAAREGPPSVLTYQLRDFAVASDGNFSLRSIREETRLNLYRKRGGMEALSNLLADPKKGRKALDQSVLADFHQQRTLKEKVELLLSVKPEDRLIVCDAGSREVENGVSGLAADYRPYAVMEGLLLLCQLADCPQAAIYLPWQDVKTDKVLNNCLRELAASGLMQGRDICIFKGPSFLPCQREIALAAVMEGRMLGEKAAEVSFTIPRIGGKETLFVSAETLSKLPSILSGGAPAYKKAGGTTLLSVVGRVGRPRVIEVPLSASIGEIARKFTRLKRVKALHLHGSSGGPFPPERFGMQLGRKPTDSFGTTGAQILVLDERTCMVSWAAYLAQLAGDACCGACTPGRNAPGAIANMLREIMAGRAGQQTMARITSLIHLVEETALCPQAITTLRPVLHTMEHFRAEFDAHIEEDHCPAGGCRL